MRRTCRTAPASTTSNRYAFEQADIRDRRGARPDLRDAPAGRGDAPRGREPCRPLDRRAGDLHRHQRRRHLHAARGGAGLLGRAGRADFRFHHVSTDEVFGTLGETGQFTETTPYAPNSPYSASKAATDHLVRAWSETYGLPVVLSNCSNNYGPFHFPEKLIPVMILNALRRAADPGLWQGRERARLALCRGPCDGAPRGRRARPGRRELQYRRQRRGDEHRHRRARSAR